MNKLVCSVRAHAEDLPLRPLLFTAGAAATAAVSIYCYIKLREGQRSTADRENKTFSKDPVWEKEQMIKSVTEAEERIKKLLMSITQLEEKKLVKIITQLEEERFQLLKQLKTLKDTVKDMGTQLTETHLESDNMIKEHEQEHEAYSILQKKYTELKKTLVHSEEFQKFFLAEVEGKHQKALKTIAHLEEEKFDLKDQVKTLRDTLQDMEDSFTETNLACDELIKAFYILREENDGLKKTLIHSDRLQKVLLAETEEIQQKALETISQLEEEKSDLSKQVIALRETLQDVKGRLIETHMECYDLLNEHKQEQEAYIILREKYHELKKIQKVFLAEAVEKQEKTLETIAQLKEEKSDLTNQVQTLRKILQDIEEQLIKTNLKCDELMDEHKRQREAYIILQEEYNELKKTLIHCEELRKISLVEAEEKHQKTMGTIAQLKTEKSDLTNQVKTLKDTVQDMNDQLIKANLECTKLMNDCEQQQRDYCILQEEYGELEKTLSHTKELQKVSMEKHQKAVEIITKMEEERFNLSNQVMTLKETVQDMGNQLFETNLEFDELINEHEQEKEAYIILQKKYNELKQTLIHNKDFQKEAEEKHQKDVTTITQLEEEKFDLLNQVKTLGDTVQFMGNQLVETHSQYDELMKSSVYEAEKKHQKDVETITELKAERTELTNQVKTLRDKMKDITYLICVTQKQCDQLTHKFEHQRAAHSRLHDENDELKKTLKDTEEFLKISLSEAVEKHQKAVKTITQLEAERSELTKQLETLRLTVQDMGNKISETNGMCEEPRDEWESHQILQSEHRVRKEKLNGFEELLLKSDKNLESNGTTTNTET